MPNPSRRREMNCNELVELVTDYLEGSLSPQDRTRFERHIDECPGCADYLEQVRTTVRLAGKTGERAAGAPVPEALLEAFRNWKLGK